MKNKFTLFILIHLTISSVTHAQLCGNDTLQLQHKWDYGTGLSLPQHVVADAMNRPYIYVTTMAGGLMILDVSNENSPSLVKTLNTSSFNSLYVMNAFQDSVYLYLALGNFFGTDVQTPGLAIVDVSDPVNPLVKDVWQLGNVVKGAAFVTVQGNYAYLGAMTAGLIILNISDKSNIQFVSEFIPDINWPLVNPTASQTPNARGMQVDGNIVYLCYDAGGLRIINVVDKVSPKETGRFINTDALNKQQAYNNIIVSNGLAYIGADYCGMEIENVSDTSNIFQVGWWNPWDCESLSNLWIGSHGHVNEVTLDEEQKIVFLSAGASELRIIDVSDPAHPDSCGGYGTFTDTLAAWGATVDDNKIYLSYITAIIPYFSVWSGVKKLEWSSTFNTVQEIQEENSISVYPNPFSSSLTVNSTSGEKNKMNVEVMDIFGRRVYHSENDHQSNSIELPLSFLPQGIYLVTIQSDEKRFHQWVIKEK